MTQTDLNLLVMLDALLAEGSVAGAARKLRLSASATSRALARLRKLTADPLLVRAGRGLVATPRAIELRDQVSRLVAETKAVLGPAPALDLKGLRRRFALRCGDGFVETFGAAILQLTAAAAPGVQIHFLQKPDHDAASLRDGSVDVETGVLDQNTGPELRAQALFRDQFVGVARPGHHLSAGPVTAETFAACQHVNVSRRGLATGLADQALAVMGLQRAIACNVTGFSTALSLVRTTDLVTVVPQRHTAGLLAGLYCFPLPFALPEIVISAMWHPRHDADQAHAWFRQVVRSACRIDPDS